MMDRTIAAAAALAVCLVSAAPVAAQENDGFYISTNLGSTSAFGADVADFGTTHPTRCDRLLYVNPTDAPVDDVCLAPLTSARQGSYHFGQNFGTAQALAVGYETGNLRFELEFLLRGQSGEPAAFDVGSDQSLTEKHSEWSAIAPPNADIYNFRSRQVFLNIAYAFPAYSGWTPYLGLGTGSATVDFGYYAAFHRKSLDEGYLEAFGGSRFDLDAAAEWQRAAAGTVSMVDAPVSESAFAFQFLAGLERAISTRTTLGLKARWTSVGTVSATLPWTLIRSHRPVHADGQTPFETDYDFEGFGYLGAGMEMRYRF